MRTSERHCELMPSRWPTEGMISELPAGADCAAGETGVTTLTETGTVTGGLVSSAPIFDEEPGKVMMMVAVNVPFGRSAGSAETVRVRPSSGRTPLFGETVSHGSSVVALKGITEPWPGMKTVCTTTCLLLTSTVALGPCGLAGGVGTMTTRSVAEYGLGPWPQEASARTR